MEERTAYVIPIAEEKTSEEQLEIIKKIQSNSPDIEIPDEDFFFHVFKR